MNTFGNPRLQAERSDIFDSQAASIQGASSYFDVVSPFYTDDYFTFTFENGTSTPVLELQGFLDLTGCNTIANGAEVYNCLVYPPPADADTGDTISLVPSDTSTIPAPATSVSPDSLRIRGVSDCPGCRTA